jgi:hypothetical protein
MMMRKQKEILFCRQQNKLDLCRKVMIKADVSGLGFRSFSSHHPSFLEQLSLSSFEMLLK